MEQYFESKKKEEYIQELRKTIERLNSYDEAIFEISNVQCDLDNFLYSFAAHKDENELCNLFHNKYNLLKNFNAVLEQLGIKIVFIENDEIDSYGQKYEQDLSNFLTIDTFFESRFKDEHIDKTISELRHIKNLGLKEGQSIKITVYNDDYTKGVIDAYFSYFYLYTEKIYKKGEHYYVATLMLAYQLETDGELSYTSLDCLITG